MSVSSRAFLANSRGSISIVMALTMIMVVGVGALAVDGIRAFRMRSKIAAAIDAAALAGAKRLHDSNITNAQIADTVTRYLDAELAAYPELGATASSPTVTSDFINNTVSVSVNVSVPTTFGQVLGVPTLHYPADSTVAFKLQRLELALVLDVTGSMNTAGKIDAMKAAANTVIDTLFANVQYTNLVKIGLAPFSAAVNVGSYSWQVTEVPTWQSYWWGGGTWTHPSSVDGCVVERLGPQQFTDAPPTSGNMFAWVDPLQAAGSHYVCPAATILPLTSNPALLKSTIAGYSASGWTAGHIGAAWGWYLLSPKWGSIWPTAPGPYSDKNTKKVVIFLTDRIFNTSFESGLAASDAQQMTASYNQFQTQCANMKAAGITVYTIALDLTDTNALDNLKQCASGPSNAFESPTGAQLTGVFMEIVQRLTVLRVAS